jgi:hypothetical protein
VCIDERQRGRVGEGVAELDAVTVAAMPETGKLVAIAARYGVAIEPPAA